MSIVCLMNKIVKLCLVIHYLILYVIDCVVMQKYVYNISIYSTAV